MAIRQSVRLSAYKKKNKEKFIVILIAQQFNKNQKQNAIVYMYLLVCEFVSMLMYVYVLIKYN